MLVWDPTQRDAKIPDVLRNLSSCGNFLNAWNVQKRKELSNKILIKRDVLKEACRVVKPETWRVISELEQQLDSVLNVEEKYWCQRARIDWLKNGDINTRFFHSKASNRRSKNIICGMFNEVGVWVESKIEIESVISNYFQNIFTSSNST